MGPAKVLTVDSDNEREIVGATLIARGLLQRISCQLGDAFPLRVQSHVQSLHGRPVLSMPPRPSSAPG